MVEIRLRNSRSRQVERFDPLDPDNVRMYLCGPTVYDRAHLGNARNVIMFDVLFRLLRQVYGSEHVTYVRNFTDVDDKINATALARKEAGATGTLEDLVKERSEETIAWYLQDMDALGNLRPDHMPRATEYIAEMVAMIETLINKRFAYVVRAESNDPPQEYVLADRERMLGETALFEVDSWREQYGKLSGRSVEDMIAGARVEVAPHKRNPMDFVLWKPSTDELPGWDSPWGRGRPGWHIECSAMSKALLGDTFDIHGGGNDLMFPHHENERAQSCCANGTDFMAQVWMHNEMLQVEGKKMSKSLGNFFTVRDLLDQGVPGEVIRFVFLSTHYSKPMDWTEKKAKEAEKTLRKWYRLTGLSGGAVPYAPVVEALADDLNTHEALTQAHALANAGDVNALRFALDILGLWPGAMPDWTTVPGFSDAETGTVFDLLQRREAARKKKDYAEADRIRDGLTRAGVQVVDTPDGPMPEKLPAFDVDVLDLVWGGQ